MGKDVTIDGLFEQEFKAAFIAVGAQKSAKLNVPGEDLKGVYPALDFLRDYNLGGKVKVGKSAAVIGGGNAAIDAARTLVRLGCEEVYLVYRRTRDEMPAADEEIEAAFKEGVIPYFLAAPVRIMGKSGFVTELICRRMSLGEFDRSGRRKPVPVEGSEFGLSVKMVLPAIGQVADLEGLSDGGGVEKSDRGFIVVNPYTLETDRPGVFAGGDAIGVEATVISAVRTGIKAAMEIDKFLGGDGRIVEKVRTESRISAIPFEIEEEVEEKPRSKQDTLPVEKRKKSFDEVELGLSEKQAVREAERCLHCDLGAEESESGGLESVKEEALTA